MEFGWGFIALFIVIFWGCGRLCGWGPRKKKERELEQMKHADDQRLTDLEQRVKGLGRGRRERLIRDAAYSREGTAEREPARLQSRRSSPLEELQKRFIEGQISLDEYEKELDRLEKIE
jgi:hypothetical protein